MILGLFETHINVSDLEAAMDFYEKVLGLEFAHKVEARRCAFYWIGGRGEAMLGLWEKPAAQVVRQHYAFRSTIEAIRHHSVAYLKERQLTPRNFLDDGIERPMIFGWMPAIAIYFRDPDGHSLEFIAMLPDEPRPEVGVVTWEDWQALD